MQILRHLESQLKYIVIETEHLFPSGLHVTKATLQGLRPTTSEISSTLYVITVSTLRELVIVSAAMLVYYLLSSVSFLSPFLCFVLSSLPLLLLFFFS